MEELDHETCKTLEGTWDAHSGANFDEHALGCMDEDLKAASFVDGRIEEGEETLQRINAGRAT